MDSDYHRGFAHGMMLTMAILLSSVVIMSVKIWLGE